MGYFASGGTKNSRPKSEISLKTIHDLQCKICPLNTAAVKSPKMLPTGSKRAPIYFLGEAPGRIEDEKDTQFVGPSGDLLWAQVPRTMEKFIRTNNVIRTHPPNNRNPERIEIEACRPSIEADIAATKPKVIVGLGLVPFRWATGFNGAMMYLVRGRLFNLNIGGHPVWYYTVAHPSGLLRQRWKDRNGREQKAADELAWERDMRWIMAHWDSLPEPQPHDPKRALEHIQIASGRKGEEDFNRVMAFLDRACKSDLSGLDIETKGLRPYWPDSKILSIAISLGMEDTLAFAWDHPKAGWTLEQKAKILEAYCNYLRSKSRKAAHNLPFEQEWHGVKFGKEIIRAGRWEDTMSQAAIRDERFSRKMKPGPLSLEFLVMQQFGFNLKELEGAKLDKNNLDKEPINEVLRYNAPDAKYHRALCERQFELLQEEDLVDAYHEKLEQVPTTILTQIMGVPVNTNITKELNTKYAARVTEYEEKILSYSLIDRVESIKKGKFVIGNPDDVVILCRDVLKSKVGLQENGKYSTEAEILRQINHPICSDIISYRQATKLKSTYTDPYSPPSADNDNRGKLTPDNLIHCIINTILVSTGRFSCEDPNLQNQPKRNKEAKEVRRQIECRPDELIASFDYGQIEARILAMASRDPVFVQMLWDRYDVHKDWAIRIAKRYPNWVKEPWDEFIAGSKKNATKASQALFKSYRDKVKNQWVFPLFFGASLGRVSNELEIPDEYLEPEMREFWKIFAGVKKWHEDTSKFYDKYGFTETLTGLHRRRYPLTFNEYINEPIQGTALEIMAGAMSSLSKRAHKTGDWNYQPRLTIHDDLTFILPKKKVEDYSEVIIEEMLSIGKKYDFVNVPLNVEGSIGPNWAQMEGIGEFNSDEFINYPIRKAA